jgi:hypothetical protein
MTAKLNYEIPRVHCAESPLHHLRSASRSSVRSAAGQSYPLTATTHLLSVVIICDERAMSKQC